MATDWETFYGKCWDILVKHAGASKSPDAKYQFVMSFVEPERFGNVNEFRFGGVFGFGGKFRRNSNNDHRVYIDYYPEDHTKRLDKLAEKVNKLLWDLQEKFVGGAIYGPPGSHEASLKAFREAGLIEDSPES